MKGADRCYRKVTQSTGASPGGCAPAASPGTRWVPAQAREASPAPRATGQSLGSASHCCSCCPSSLPGLHAQNTHPCRATHTRAAWHQATTSTGYHAQKGPKEEALPTKITPLSSSSTAHTAHRAGESKHHGTPHARHSLPVPRATSKAASHLRRGVGKPQPSTSCQICLATPPTCNFHWLLIVQAVAAASFRDLCPKGCLQKQVSESACAQRSKKSTYNMILKVNRCKVSANFTSLCYSWSTAT